MSAAEVKEAVLQITQTADDFACRLERNNVATRYTFVDPILWALGWRTWVPRECLPDFQLSNRGRVDYALLDAEQNPAVLIMVGSWGAYRYRERARLGNCVRGIGRGVAVLTCRRSWEIYDLGFNAREFHEKQVVVLTLDRESPDAVTESVLTLHYWIAKEWWR